MIKRYKLSDPWPIPDPYDGTSVEVVLASDFDALEARVKELEAKIAQYEQRDEDRAYEHRTRS